VLSALSHLSIGANDTLPIDGHYSVAAAARTLRQLSSLPSLKRLDLTEYEYDCYAPPLKQLLPGLVVDWYRLGCD
jgi:hypothetical protein